MAPSFNKSLKKKQPYFSIIEKNQEHPKRPYFDIVCYEIIKDDRFYKKLRYKNKPFFWGIVKFERFEGKKYMEPFKLWKLKKDKRTEEIEERYVDPDLFRNLIIMSKFIVIGDLKNKPSGYGLDNYQIVEEDTHKVQEIQQHEYKKSLQPVVDYCKNIQFDMRNVREYLFCHSCKQKNKYTLLDKESRYRSQAFYVCKKCAGREILSILKDKKVKISKTLKIILRDLLKKYKNVHKVLNVFNPNFNVIEHPEATLVNVKKKKIKHAEIKPQTIYDFEMSALLRMYFESHNHGKLLPVQIMSLEKGLMEGQDELIVAATSAGKTMIGEMAGLSKILENKIRYLKEKRNISNPFKKLNTQKKLPKSLKKLTKGQRKYIKELLRTKSKAKMLYLVPIVALANMRYREYQELEQYGINVALRVGVSHISGKGKRHKDEFGDFRNADVIVGTYEALDVLLRSGHPYHLHGVKTVVIDEIQKVLPGS